MKYFFVLIGLCLALAVALPGAAEPAAGKPSKKSEKIVQTFEKKGVRVEFAIEPEPASNPIGSPLMEGHVTDIRFKITDAATGTPISPLEPAVWINLLKGKENQGGREPLDCRQKIERYLQGSLGFQADVDLNKFFILVMNNDHTISVVDPILGISGITQLYALILLEETGEDWLMSADGRQLYVSMPKAGKVAVVDLDTFKVARNIEVGGRPMRLALQPDGRYLWVARDGKGADAGVAVIDLHQQRLVATIATGPGQHDMAIAADSLTVFVSNSAAGTVSLIKTETLEKSKDLRVGQMPVAIAYSPLSRAAYVIGQEDGTLSIIDEVDGKVVDTLPLAPGLAALKLDPTGRWCFIANPGQSRVSILDVSSNSVRHTLNIDGSPHQFAFTDTFAYVRLLASPKVEMVQLNQLSQPKTPTLAKVPLGSKAPGESPLVAAAPAIAPTGEWDTILAANPADRAVYYYMEGMIAPMGTFPTYGRVPKAVRVIDRSLKEVEKGVYATKLRLPLHGDYDVAFLIDSPWIYNCFSFSAQPNPILEKSRPKTPAKIAFLDYRDTVPAGQEFKVRFSLTDPQGGQPLAELKDVTALLTRPPGNWQIRRQAESKGAGEYEVSFKPDRPGVYYVYFSVPSLSVGMRELPFMVLNVAAP